jgi:hypothetical protein
MLGVERMKTLVEKHTIINLKQQGYSNRKVARITKLNRKTVAKYWNEYKEQSISLENTLDISDINVIQESIASKPKYDSSNRKPRKYTEDMDKRLDEILLEEERKSSILGNHKQKLTKLQMHEKLVAEGFKISYTTISTKINEKVANRNNLRHNFQPLS